MPNRLAVSLLASMTALLTGLAWAQGVGIYPAPTAMSNGEMELKALARAYPDRIEDVALRDGDWALLLDGSWYSWAHGRILPEEELPQWRQYAGLRFDRYPIGTLPPILQLDAASAAGLRKMVRDADVNPPERWEGFLETLLQAGSRRETADRIVRVSFLGFSVDVHERIAPAFLRVARACEILRARDRKVAAYFSGLKEIDGFNYRNVAGTKSRSMHGYGLAVDLLPKSYGGKQTYWRWTLESNDEWWAVPYGERWMAPDSVVAAFEENGFVWGGKWLFFDTMHFEYRPEILILSRAREAR